MSSPATVWEYGRLSVARRLELSLKKWDEVHDPDEISRHAYVYRWETHLEHAYADSPLELIDKLALEGDEHWARDISPHAPLSVMNALGHEGWELVHVLRFEEPELAAPERFAGREGWYYLFRRTVTQSGADRKRS